MMTEDAKKIVDALRRCSINDSDTVIDAIALIERMSADLEQVKRERDAAVHDLAKYGDCDACKKAYTEEISCLKPCEFEWRGVCAEYSGGGGYE